MGTLTEYADRWEYRGYSDTKLVIPPATKCVHLVQCENIVVDDLETSGVNYGNLLRIDSSFRMRIRYPHLHDGLLDVWTPGSQITGIGIDGSPEGGVYSDDILIEHPHIENLQVTAAAYAGLGNKYETDGINIAHASTRRVRVLHPYIKEVGEGFDCFGARCGIIGGEIHNAHQYGIKLIHGATACYAFETQICWAGIGGVGVFGSNSATRNADRNIFRGVDVRVVNYEGKYTANDNFAFATLPGTVSSKATNTIFDSCSSDKSAKWDILANAGAGTGNQYLRTINARVANIANPEGATIA